MQTTLQSEFIPYTYQKVANNGDILVLRFTTKADSEVLGNPRDCGQLVTLNCKAGGIPNLSAAAIEWVTGCGVRRIVSSGSEYELIVLAISPPPPADVTEIEVTIKVLVSGFRNTFRLYAVVDAEQILLARGIIYTDIFIGSTGIDVPPDGGGGGGSGDEDDFIIGEVPNGLVNGANATYTTDYAFIPESVAVFVNGVLQKNGVDYTTIGTDTIVLAVSMTAGETILVDYIRG